MPEEAKVKALQAFEASLTKPRELAIADALQAAAPVLCARERKELEYYAEREMERADKAEDERDQAAQQERERVKEALLSDEVIAAANAESRERHGFHPYPHITHTLLKAGLEAALTTLDKEID